jgi:Sulfotransferase domain
MGNIAWIASYPRSGNTWLRCFLAGLFQKNKALDLGDLPTLHCASRRLLEQSLCFSTGELTSSEINILRPDAYRHWAQACESPTPLFVKVHDCYERNREGLKIFPSDASRSVIYLLRNPLEICVSYTHFLGFDDYDKAADYICDSQHSHPLDHSNLFGQVHQHIADWSTHTKSWNDNNEIPTKILKYEDMKKAPLETFFDIVRFLQLPYGKEEVIASLKKCDFFELQKNEEQSGFRDTPYKGNKFFREGKSNSWQDKLEQHTIKRIVRAHGEEMFKYGYLKEDGTPI